MPRFVLGAPGGEAGQRRERVDKVLARLMPEVSRATIQRWIDDERVLVDGQRCRPRDSVGAGNIIDVDPGSPPPSNAEADAGVEYGVLFEDEHLIVVDKPAGLVVHPARGHRSGTLVNGLLARPGFARPPSDPRDEAGGLRPGIVHRIDRDTSGVLVVAKDELAREGLKAQLQRHSMEREYLALTLGVPVSGRIESFYTRHPRSRMRFTSRANSGRCAVTEVEVRQTLAGDRTALVACRLETGRTHQIRVHLSEQLGAPILADRMYGRTPGDADLAEVAAELGRQALHARVLGFVHPHSGRTLRFESPVPADFARAQERLAGL